MSDFERYVDPLFRPPLTLSVVAAALKYVATVALLGDPLLMTRSDYLKKRDATGPRRLLWLVAQVLFLGLAVNTLLCDIGIVETGFHHFSGWQRLHFLASVLAFSPNTVAAVAGAFTADVRAGWLSDLRLHSSLVGMAFDVIALFYAICMMVVYLMPLMLVTLAYGLLGGCAIIYVFCWDAMTLPWRIFDGNWQAIWIAVPVVVAMSLSHALIVLLTWGHIQLFEMRHPELADRIRREGTRVNALQMKFRNITLYVPASIIGVADEVKGLVAAGARDFRSGGQAEHQEELLDVGALHQVVEPGTCLVTAPAGLEECRKDEENERCVLNDDKLACLFVSKIFVSLAIPILQVSVVIAAKIYLGDWPWHATLNVFGERSWEHYKQHVQTSGTQGALPLFWYFL